MMDGIANWFQSTLGAVMPGELVVFIVSMIPILELRGGLIVASAVGVPIWWAIPICILGNMIPVVLVLLFITPLFNLMKKAKIFRPMVEKLEKNGEGLNLTKETRNGILCHTEGEPASTLEGRVVRFADKIAYINHDIEDAIMAGVLNEEDIPISSRELLGGRKTQRITTLVESIIEASADKPDIIMPEDIASEFRRLSQFMFEAVYTNPVAKAQEGKAEELVGRLYEYYLTRPDKLPEDMRRIYEQEGAHRAACDYISSMSDRFAVNCYEQLFVPTFWTE